MTLFETPTVTSPAVAGDGAGASEKWEGAAPAPLVITVIGHPAPQGSKRHVGHGVMVESSKHVKPWRQDVAAAAVAVVEKLPTFYRPSDGQTIRAIPCPPPTTGPMVEYDDGTVVSAVPRQCMSLPLDCPLAVRMVFSFTRPRSHYRTGRNAHLLKTDAPVQPMGPPDLSKLARSTEDSLTGIIWRDDARISEYLRLAKVWCGEDPEALDVPGCRIEIRVVTA